MHKRIAVVGSRDYKFLGDVADFIRSLPTGTVVVSGGARGVDSIAASTARARHLDVDVYPANWNEYGKKAGFLRNIEIIDNCDIVTAFWDEISKGTQHTINLAKKRNIPITIYTYKIRYSNGPAVEYDENYRNYKGIIKASCDKNTPIGL